MTISVSEVVDWPGESQLWEAASPVRGASVPRIVFRAGLLAGSLMANVAVWYGIGHLVQARVG